MADMKKVATEPIVARGLVALDDDVNHVKGGIVSNSLKGTNILASNMLPRSLAFGSRTLHRQASSALLSLRPSTISNHRDSTTTLFRLITPDGPIESHDRGTIDRDGSMVLW